LGLLWKFATLNLGIVREEAVECSMLANEVFKSAGHVRLKAHGVDNSLRAGLANIELGHSSISMTQNVTIMVRRVAEESIHDSVLVPSVDIASGKEGLEMLPKR
jgi:hypothetical protein